MLVTIALRAPRLHARRAVGTHSARTLAASCGQHPLLDKYAAGGGPKRTYPMSPLELQLGSAVTPLGDLLAQGTLQLSPTAVCASSAGCKGNCRVE